MGDGVEEVALLQQWVNRNRGPIGLHLGTRAVRLVQLDRMLNKPGQTAQVLAAAGADLPVDLPADPIVRNEVIATIIKPLLDRGGFSGRRVVSCMPSNSVQYKNMRMPQMPMSELRSAVEWEARDRLQLGNVSHDLQFVAAGQVRQGEDIREEIIVLAAPTANIEAHVDLLERCGLEPTAIDAVPTALARCVLDRGDTSASAETCMVIDMGYAASSVLIVSGGRVTFFRVIDVGGAKLDKAIAKQLGLSQEEAWALRTGQTKSETTQQAVDDAQRGVLGELAREIGLCLRYHSVTFRGAKPGRAFLVGTHAVTGDLMKLMAGEADMTIEPGVVLPKVDPISLTVLDTAEWNKPSVDDIENRKIEPVNNSAGLRISSWAVAMGLAMRTDMRPSKRGAA